MSRGRQGVIPRGGLTSFTDANQTPYPLYRSACFYPPLGCLHANDRPFYPVMEDGSPALFGLSNCTCFGNPPIILADAELNLFTQTWSPGVEEQFYMVFLGGPVARDFRN